MLLAMTPASRTIGLSLFTAAVVAVFLGAWVFHYYAFMGPDAGARFLMIREASAGGHLFLRATDHLGTARVLDPFVGYTVAVPRGVCTVYPALFPFVAGTLYFAFGPVGLVLPSVLGGVAAGWFVTRSARVWELRAAPWAAAIFVFGTPLVIYSSTFWDHSIEIAVVAAATHLLLCSLRTMRGATRRTIVAGVVMGCGVWIHELVLLAGLCFAVALAGNRRAMLRWLGGLAVPVGAWMAFNRVVYGAFRGPHLMGPLAPGSPTMMGHLASLADFRDRAADEIAGGHGALELLFVVGFVGLVAISRFRRVSVALPLVALLSVLAVWFLLRSGYAGGLFEVTPWFLLAFVGLRPTGGWRDHARRVFAGAAILFVAAVVATPVYPGLNWGSRYLLTISPVLALLAMDTLERLRSWLRGPGTRAVVAVYALVAVLAFTRATQTYRAKRIFDGIHARTVSSIRTRETATDRWWLAPELAAANLQTSLALVAYVPASEQLPAPIPPDPDRVVRDAFFERLRDERLHDFSYVGGESTLAVLRIEARWRGFRQVDVRRVADFVVARFEATPGISAERPVQLGR